MSDFDMGPEVARLNASFPAAMDNDTKRSIWTSAQNILQHKAISDPSQNVTVLALGYVQSGKTTSITALTALAADKGYRVIVAFLGVTNILLDQNKSRIERALGLHERSDYIWYVETNPSGRKSIVSIKDNYEKGRVIFIPILKHAGRIDKLSDVLNQALPLNEPVLIIDDEADQTSLNTETDASKKVKSRTYGAITNLRQTLANNLYVQYTATPYAPLLIDQADHLRPEFVEFLHPGKGYVGGREFFVDFAAQVVRDVPALEEQNTQVPIQLPRTLVVALGAFVAGAAVLLQHDSAGAPVSMLVHSTHRNDIQQRYHFLLDRKVRQWRESIANANSIEDLPEEILAERKRLTSFDVPTVDDANFVAQVKLVLREAVLWLVNSSAAVNRVDWRVAPIHILVGGNKLDRGFTVEGLTITYMNRKASDQIDTLEQRARAFGYRKDQLPYCQFFASKRTTKLLKDIVFTEYDLRAKLQDHIEAGGSITSWSKEIGLLLPPGTRPTRTAVVRALSNLKPGWHSLRRPSLDVNTLEWNRNLVTNLGLLDAQPVSYGRLSHPTIYLPVAEVVERLIRPWRVTSYSPDWRKDEIMTILDFAERHPRQDEEIPILLMQDGGQPRQRRWDDEVGFANLFQGRDPDPTPGLPAYPGDRNILDLEGEPDQIVVEVHHLKRRYDDGIAIAPEILTLAVHLGERTIVRAQKTEPIENGLK